ncbi:Uncharacterised protein [uncultured archaeon]|nr:Uncharacterised protein [uncultured archaeon]
MQSYMGAVNEFVVGPYTTTPLAVQALMVARASDVYSAGMIKDPPPKFLLSTIKSIPSLALPGFMAQ